MPWKVQILGRETVEWDREAGKKVGPPPPRAWLWFGFDHEFRSLQFIWELAHSLLARPLARSLDQIQLLISAFEQEKKTTIASNDITTNERADWFNSNHFPFAGFEHLKRKGDCERTPLLRRLWWLRSGGKSILMWYVILSSHVMNASEYNYHSWKRSIRY